MTLDNWRAQNATLQFSDGVNEIKGKNGSGKSSFFNAWVWLLTGTDAEDRQNAELFDKNETLNNDTPAATVTAVLEVDGVELKLARSAKSAFVRRRGREEYEKSSSDKYSFFVDDIEISASAYGEKVSTLFNDQPTDVIKMIVNPNYYNTLEWKKLRTIFQRMVGEIKESDFEGDYSLIEPIVAKVGFESAKLSVATQVNLLKKQLDTVAADIRALTSSLPDLSGCDNAEKKIEADKERIAQIDAEIAGMTDANKPFVEKRRAEEEEIARLEETIKSGQAMFSLRYEDVVMKLEQAYKSKKAIVDEVVAYNVSLDAKRKVMQRDIESARSDVDYLENEYKQLKEKNAECKGREFSEECPYCHQQLPYERLAEERAKFNAAKDAEHEHIVERGRDVANRLAERRDRLNALQAEYDSLTAKDLPSADVEREAWLAAKAAHKSYMETDECANVLKQIEKLRAALTEIPTAHGFEELTKEKADLLDEIKLMSEITAYRTIFHKTEQAIEAKKQEQQTVAQTLAFEEHKLIKFVEYEREKAAIISTRANQYLRIARVDMLSQNKNGDWADCCTVTVGGVGITANTASKIQASVDICSAFQSYFEIAAPIFIDDVNNIDYQLIPDTKGQQIRLRFDKAYNKPTTI
jgi:hypothetical protein